MPTGGKRSVPTKNGTRFAFHIFRIKNLRGTSGNHLNPRESSTIITSLILWHLLNRFRVQRFSVQRFRERKAESKGEFRHLIGRRISTHHTKDTCGSIRSERQPACCQRGVYFLRGDRAKIGYFLSTIHEIPSPPPPQIVTRP